jgi:hypothetical protein
MPCSVLVPAVVPDQKTKEEFLALAEQLLGHLTPAAPPQKNLNLRTAKYLF